MTIKRLAIYCGSRMGNDKAFQQAATDLGQMLAKKGIGIVYGGSENGLMGLVAQAALEQGGEVIGVMPVGLTHKETPLSGLTELQQVNSMHERKQRMFDLVDAFVALPGGMGTLDELIEVLCWANMGHHQKPCVCLDVNNYWQPLFDLFAHIQKEGFAGRAAPLLRASSADEVISLLKL
ncbi:MAG: TIGR00730 family Rossman fold protein [Oceanobacter sp.]